MVAFLSASRGVVNCGSASSFSDIYKRRSCKWLSFAQRTMRFPEAEFMDWMGASVIAPRSNAPIEFEIAAEAGVRTGCFHDSQFYSAGDPAGYPRKLIRRWRYLADESTPAEVACLG